MILSDLLIFRQILTAEAYLQEQVVAKHRESFDLWSHCLPPETQFYLSGERCNEMHRQILVIRTSLLLSSRCGIEAGMPWLLLAQVMSCKIEPDL